MCEVGTNADIETLWRLYDGILYADSLWRDARLFDFAQEREGIVGIDFDNAARRVGDVEIV